MNAMAENELSLGIRIDLKNLSGMHTFDSPKVPFIPFPIVTEKEINVLKWWQKALMWIGVIYI